MSTFDDVRTIALALPRTEEREGGWHMGPSWRIIGGTMFAWSRPVRGRDLEWMRAQGDEPGDAVLGVRVDGEEGKREVLAANPRAAFTVPHFDGYPAVLLRLPETPVDLLRELVVESWLLRAPKRIARDWLEENGMMER
ncbi:hypothetical protein QMO46_09560 [Microbacterium barkeri]|uniref:MmcQ/YjbR family DNA-binding protein n=1 Tax=Microbacterium barkeri TaxID=33917 RepID=UPI0024AEF243|nr:hypothetical protein [Microbacterium barkeri]MDI6943745.1 hypothetical protein [Microbacterium barkeri]